MFVNDTELKQHYFVELLKRIQDVPHESTLVQLEVLEEKRTALGEIILCGVIILSTSILHQQRQLNMT